MANTPLHPGVWHGDQFVGYARADRWPFRALIDDVVVAEEHRGFGIGTEILHRTTITKDRWDYAIVASGGFFIPGTDSIVVPLRYLQIDQERNFGDRPDDGNGARPMLSGPPHLPSLD